MGIKARENQTSETSENEEITMEGRVDGNNITVDMILLDLAKGSGRDAICNRYFYTEDGIDKPFETWMVSKIFKDPSLKNRKATKVRSLPFAFAGTSEPVEPAPMIPTDKVEITGDPTEASENTEDSEKTIEID